MKKFFKGFGYAIEGIINSFKSELNLKVHFLCMIVVIIIGCLLKISKIEWIICIILFGLVIGAEIMNTAIENTVDLCCKEKNELAKKAKDASAGSVLVVAIASAVVGLMIFLPKLI